MTTSEAIDSTRFWTDQYDTWFTDHEVVGALNRAMMEFVTRRYEMGLTTEREDSDLSALMPVPISGTGNRALLGGKGVLFVLGVTVQYRDETTKLLSDEIAVRPVKPDRLATSLRSVFHKPTDAYPLYQRTADSQGEVIDIRCVSIPDTYRVYYVKDPTLLDETKPDAVWNELGETARNEIIQGAKRMLLAAKLPDYQAQVSVEGPLATALPVNQ